MSSSATEYDSTKIYEIVTVEPVKSTNDMPGKWCRYVVERGASKIEGLHAGDLDEVTEHAKNFVEILNERFAKKTEGYRSPRKK